MARTSTRCATREARGRRLNLKRHPELLHDDTIWHRFTEEIFLGMGGPAEVASECATEIEQGWELSENFELYEDALPVLDELRRADLGIGLVSNGIRDLNEFVVHHRLDVMRSSAHGHTGVGRTRRSSAALKQLDVEPLQAVWSVIARRGHQGRSRPRHARDLIDRDDATPMSRNG
jgi:hypothetical protein